MQPAILVHSPFWLFLHAAFTFKRLRKHSKEGRSTVWEETFAVHYLPYSEWTFLPRWQLYMAHTAVKTWLNHAASGTPALLTIQIQPDKLYHIGLNTFFTSLASSLLTSFSTFLFSLWGSYKHYHFEVQGHLEHQVLTHFTPFQEVIAISSILDPVSFEQGHKLCWEWGIRARKYFSLLKESLRAE